MTIATQSWSEEVSTKIRLRLAFTDVVAAQLHSRTVGLGSPVRHDDPMLCEIGPWQSIFGQAPLPDPYRFFLEFQRHVRDALGIVRDPAEYLNFRGSMGSWIELVYGRSYLLLTAPAAVIPGAVAMLEAQSVPHIALGETRGTPAIAAAPAALGFRCGRSWLIAGAVTGELVAGE